MLTPPRTNTDTLIPTTISHHLDADLVGSSPFTSSQLQDSLISSCITLHSMSKIVFDT